MLVVYPEAVWYTYVDRADIDEIIERHVARRRDRREAAHLTPRTTERYTIAGPAGALEIVLNVPAARAARHRARRASASAAGRHARQQGRADAREDLLRAGLRRDALQFPRRRRDREGAFDDGVGETADALAALAHARRARRSATCRSCSPASRSERSCRRASRESVAAERLVLVGPAVRRFAGRGRARRHDRRPRRGGRRRAARRRARVGAAAAAAGGRLSRLRPLLPWPAAAAAARRSPGCGTGTRWRPVPDAAHPPRARCGRRAARAGRRPPRRRAAQVLRRQRSRARPVVRDPPRRVLRPARPERRRQDDDAALLPRPHRPGRRRRSRWSASRCRRRRAQARIRVGVVPQLDNLDPDFTVTENLQVYGRYFGIDRATLAARIPALLEFAGPRERGDARPAHAVGRHEAAPDARARAGQRPRAPDPRRADDRARSAGAAPDLGRPAPAAVAGQDDPAHHALHGRGRAPRDAPRGDRPRHADRLRHAARADRGARRARGDRGLRRRRAGLGRGARAARSSTRLEIAGETAFCYATRPAAAARRRSRTRTACATCTGRRTSRTCSSSSPAASCATEHAASTPDRPASRARRSP